MKQNMYKLVVESLVIVASILLAFTIQAWWDGREQLENETIVLQSVLSDLQEIKLVLGRDRAYNEGILESTNALLQAETEGHTLSEQEIDRLIGNTLYHNAGAELESAALGALVNGGTLASISNPTLRQDLASIYNKIATVRAFYKNDENFHHNRMIPFSIANTDLLQITNSIQLTPGQPDRAYVGPKAGASSTVIHSVLLKNMEFRNLLVARTHRVLDIQNNAYPGFAEMLDATIEKIEAELVR